MYRYKQILVGLNRTELDTTVLRYAGLITRMARSEKIIFASTSENLEMPKAIRDKYPEILSTREEFAGVMMENGEKEFQNLISSCYVKEFEIQPYYVLNSSPSKAILEAAKNLNVNLIVIGARGRSRAAAILLGRVTEKLIWNASIPVLAVKKKGTGMSLLQALFDM